MRTIWTKYGPAHMSDENLPKWSESQKLNSSMTPDWTTRRAYRRIGSITRQRTFSFEFKRQVARGFLEGRAGMHELARRHNLSHNLIRLWIQKYEAGDLTGEVGDAVRSAEYDSKIAALERKVGQLTMELDLLKKEGQLARR
jgi:transposase